MKLTALFEPAPEGGYTCFFEEYPGVFSEGETVEEARENLLDALREVVSWHRAQSRARAKGEGVIQEELELAAI